MNGNDKWMVEAGSGFRFAAKALQMRFSGPGAQANYFERDGAIETFLMGAINHPLTAAADFLQQFIIAKVAKYFCWSRSFPSIQDGQAIIVARDQRPRLQSRHRTSPRPVS